MKHLLILLVGIIVVQHSTTAHLHNGFFKAAKKIFDPRVIGGSDAERYQFPWMVSLTKRGSHVCGGSIVSANWVITAGHCCDKQMLLFCTRMEVIAGQLNALENHEDIQKSLVAKVVVHPGYVMTNTEIENDIAVLQLVTTLTFTKAVQPVKLPFAGQKFDTAWLSGWGIYTRTPSLPVTLQCLKMNVITNDECQEVLKKFSIWEPFPSLDGMVCAMPPSGGSETGCSGDSGGPLADNGILVGVTSWAVYCEIEKDNAPTVFTAVNEYLDFINENVNDIPQ